MQILDGKKGLMLVLDYAASRYEEASMVKYQQMFIKIAKFLASNVSQKDVTVKDVKSLIAPKKKSFFARLFGRKD